MRLIVQQKRLIELVILGVLLAILGIITYQYMLAFIIIAVIVVALFFKEWADSLVEKISAGNRASISEITRICGSLAAMKADIARIEERLNSLERGGRG
ncbi:MAG: hypothetical protein A4E35_01581 [Methanoregula sp. PtaU1.Bin051]|nr:MAG: hypothetical protein A4E35_01581 [Methanoregula sp. PtaU1.Bin051]